MRDRICAVGPLLTGAVPCLVHMRVETMRPFEVTPTSRYPALQHVSNIYVIVSMYAVACLSAVMYCKAHHSPVPPVAYKFINYI
jgi:hypothetical protein